MNFHKDGSRPGPGQIFVFGSNLSGIHGAGAAKAALDYFGACFGVGVGFYGSSYAIPTKNEYVDTMRLDDIAVYVRGFVRATQNLQGTRFFVTRIGCGLAGLTDAQMAPLFSNCGDNCSFAEEWAPYLS